MMWLFFGLFAHFFAALMVVLSRSGPEAGRRRTQARIGLIALCALPAGFLVAFAFAADVDPAPEELVERTCGGGSVYPAMAAAKNLAYRLDDSLAAEVAERAGSSPCELQSMGAMRESYRCAYGDGNEEQREKALSCIVRVRDDGTAGFLETALAGDESARVRRAAAEGLADICDPSSVPALLEALSSEEDEDVVVGVVRALAAIGEPAVDPLVGERCDPGVTPDLGSRLERALVAIGEPAALPVVAQLGTANSGWAECVLAGIGEPAKKHLQAKIDIEKDNWNVRCAAAIPLLRIVSSWSPEIIGHLINYLRNRDFAGATLHVANSYADFIDLGIRGTEYFLIDALNAHGNIPMGEDYLNCGNDLLDQAARAWAARRGYIVVTTAGVAHSGPTWGGY